MLKKGKFPPKQISGQNFQKFNFSAGPVARKFGNARSRALATPLLSSQHFRHFHSC